MDTKWYRRSGAIAGGIVAGVLAIGTAFAVVNVTDTSSQTGELSPVSTAEPTEDPVSSDVPVLRVPGPSTSPDTSDDDRVAGPTSSPDDDDDASPGPSASPDDDGDDGDDDNSGPSDNSGPGSGDDDDDDDRSGHGGGDDDDDDDNSGRGSGDDD